MTACDITSCRLANQQIAHPKDRAPGEIVALLGAVQAQDYLGALWAIGLRTANATEADIERAIANRTIIRTWPLRGTLHFVAAADLRWMLKLLTPRIIAASKRRQQRLGLDEKTIGHSRELFVAALQGGNQLTRDAMYTVLETACISTAGQRGLHILWRLANEGTICFGTREGKQPTFALVDEWAPNAKSLEREEALAELARRYFAGRGPATLQDFVWWSGLKISDAKAGLDLAAPTLVKETPGNLVYWMSQKKSPLPNPSRSAYLLPGFDEYMLGYKDRSAALDPRHAQKILPENNGRFMSTMVLNGKVTGTWKRTLGKKAVVITMEPFISLNQAAKQAFGAAARRYGRFVGMPVEL
jgi:hypothetical protein